MPKLVTRRQIYPFQEAGRFQHPKEVTAVEAPTNTARLSKVGPDEAPKIGNSTYNALLRMSY